MYDSSYSKTLGDSAICIFAICILSSAVPAHRFPKQATQLQRDSSNSELLNDFSEELYVQLRLVLH